MYKVLPLTLAFLHLSGSSWACSVQNGIKLTNYGFPDASGTPAYKCNGNTVVPTVAGDKTKLGDGSFGNPYAAAAAGNSVFKKCSLIYVPLLEKYFRVQDDCSGCGVFPSITPSPLNPTSLTTLAVSKQVDLYLIQSNQNIGQTSCEQQFGTFNYNGKVLHEVILAPGAGFQTNIQPLFANGKCFNKVADGRIFPNRDGTVNCGANAAEVLTTADVAAGANEVDNSGSTNDGDPAARHKGMAPANQGGQNATNAEQPPTRMAARDFSA